MDLNRSSFVMCFLFLVLQVTELDPVVFSVAKNSPVKGLESGCDSKQVTN